MSHVLPPSARRLVRTRARVAMALALLAISAPLARGGETAIVYSLNDRGLLTIGGTVLENLKSKFDPGVNPPANPNERWVDLLVDGPDRYVLRGDGRIQFNGTKLRTLPTVGGLSEWRRLSLGNDGTLYALRFDGTVAADDDASQIYPPLLIAFTDILTQTGGFFGTGADVFALRADGTIFGSTFDSPGIQLLGGNGIGDNPQDGLLDTTWIRLVPDPSTQEVLALRVDGKVHKFAPADFDASSGIDPGDVDPGGGIGGGSGIGLAMGAGEGGPPEGPPAGVLVAELPFPTAAPLFVSDFFVDLAVDDDGTWYVLRTDGAIFRMDDHLVPLVDLPGDGLDPAKAYVDLEIKDGKFWALRFDGLLYTDVSGEPFTDLNKKRYVRLRLATEGPDLSNFKNRKPVTAVYKTTLVEGEAVVIPVIITDVEKLAEDLEVNVDLSKLPGATWDAEARTVSWPGGTAGKYQFVVSVNDGLLKKAKANKYQVRVVPADTDPLKNRPPNPVKIKTLQGLVGFEIVVPVYATDRDGDPLRYLWDETKGIFALGATFDEKTNTIRWTPAFDDVGKWKATVNVYDNVKIKPIKLKFNVVNPLIF
jgi:hypothetical protein